MLVIPAIDILGGRCVRLVRGDYTNPTVYSDDPADVAASFGATAVIVGKALYEGRIKLAEALAL